MLKEPYSVYYQMVVFQMGTGGFVLGIFPLNGHLKGYRRKCCLRKKLVFLIVQTFPKMFQNS